MTTAIHHPTALADQVEAAATDARRAITTAAACGHVALISPESRWLRAQVTALARSLTTGRAKVCSHLNPNSAPQVIHAAVWAPDLVVCGDCRWLLTPATGAEDFTCDRCRMPVERIHSGAVAAGPIVLGYGLCTPCLTTVTSPTVAGRPDGKPRSRKRRNR